jgi:hypothetical protein
MKLYSIMLACLMFMPIVGMSQDTTKVLVSKSMLTQEQLKSMQNQDMSPENVSKWAGVGKEVGTAVNGALSAVTDQASKFGETKIGKITIFLVVWKVIGKDMIRIVLSSILFVVILSIIVWSMRKYIAHKYLVGETVGADGKVTSRKWDETNSDGESIAFHFLMIGILTAICALMAFV